MVPKLHGACYGVTSMFHISNTDSLKTIYVAYFHTSNKCNLPRPTANLSSFQKSAYYDSIKILNNLPYTKPTSLKYENPEFKSSLGRYLNTFSCYSVEEFLMFKNDIIKLYIMIQWIFKKWDEGAWTGLFWLRTGGWLL
jgi:hypothetical protein